VESSAYKKLGNKLKSVNRRDSYPNPTDGPSAKRDLYAAIGCSGDDTLPYATTCLPLLTGSIKSIFESGYSHRLISKRIVLNLGHLNFALERNNITLHTFNKFLDRSPVVQRLSSGGFRTDYMDWVHFREYFILLDLVHSYPARYFTDSREYSRLKGFLS
jgi:hypothetical protein